jgi:hypothetical protein
VIFFIIQLNENFSESQGFLCAEAEAAKVAQKQKALFESFVEGFSMGGKRRGDLRLFNG